MTNEEIEILLKKLNCTVYKLNPETNIIEKTRNGGGSTVGVQEIVNITTELNNKNIRFIIVGDGDIQIER